MLEKLFFVFTLSFSAALGAQSLQEQYAATDWYYHSQSKAWVSHMGAGESLSTVTATIEQVAKQKVVNMLLIRNCIPDDNPDREVTFIVWQAGEATGRYVPCKGPSRTSDRPPLLEKAMRPFPYPIQEVVNNGRKIAM